jgi:hypothetical protein
MPETEPRWMDEETACAYLGNISSSTLRRRAKEAGAAMKVGARVVYDRKVLDQIPQPQQSRSADTQE